MDNTKDYQSPITLIFQTMEAEAAKRAKKLDEDIYEAILHYGVVVDKEELIRALAYDRDQYALGFANGFDKGKESAVVHAHWNQIANGFMVCSHCEEPVEENRKYSFCPLCGARMDEEVFTAENPVVVEEAITDPPVATEEEKEKYLNKEIDYIKSYRIEEEHKYD